MSGRGESCSEMVSAWWRSNLALVMTRESTGLKSTRLNIEAGEVEMSRVLISPGCESGFISWPVEVSVEDCKMVKLTYAMLKVSVVSSGVSSLTLLSW